MMKTLLLLACVVLVSGSPHPEPNRTILKEMVNKLKTALDDVPKGVKDREGNTIFLKDVKMKHKSCKPEYFCQVEHQLKEKVSSLSGATFEHFRSDKELMRNLNTYNNRSDAKGCRGDVDGMDEIPLHDFLQGLVLCVKNVLSLTKLR